MSSVLGVLVFWISVMLESSCLLQPWASAEMDNVSLPFCFTLNTPRKTWAISPVTQPLVAEMNHHGWQVNSDVIVLASLLSVTSTELRRSNFSVLRGLWRSWSRSVRSREWQRGGQAAWRTKMLHGVARSSASPVLSWFHRLVPLLFPSLQPPSFSFCSMLSRRGSTNAELYLGQGRADVWLRPAGGHCHLPTAGSARSARHRYPGMDDAGRAVGMACLSTRGWFVLALVSGRLWIPLRRQQQESEPRGWGGAGGGPGNLIPNAAGAWEAHRSAWSGKLSGLSHAIPGTSIN